MNTFIAAASSAFLFVAAFAGSAGLRAALLIIAAIGLAISWRSAIAPYVARLPRAIAVAFAAWALVAIASLSWSVDRAYTLGELRAEILYPTLALAVFFFAAQQSQRWRLWVGAMLAGTVAVFVQHAAQDGLGWKLSPHSVFEQRGLWSTHLALMAPLVLLLGWRAPWGAGRSAGITAAALAWLFFAAWQTENRMIWVAFAAQFLIAASLMQVTAADGAAAALRRVTVAAALISTIGLAASIADRTTSHSAAALASASVDSHTQSPSAAAVAPVDTVEPDMRPRIWSVAWSRFTEAPWLGHGFGREILAADFIPLTPRVLNHPRILHGHNVFVDMALQLGVVGLAAFVWLLALLAREYLGYLRHAQVAPLGLTGLLVLVGFLAKCLTDDFLHRHNALAFWALNAMLVGCARATRAREDEAKPPAEAARR